MDAWFLPILLSLLLTAVGSLSLLWVKSVVESIRTSASLLKDDIDEISKTVANMRIQETLYQEKITVVNTEINRIQLHEDKLEGRIRSIEDNCLMRHSKKI
jgi:cytoskeletal protein RodZ